MPRPLQEDEKSRLREKGIDPEGFVAYSKDEISAENQSTEAPKTDGPSWYGSAARGGLRAAPSGAIGLGVAQTIGVPLAAAATPFIGPFAAAIPPIVGFGASALARSIQEKVAPQSYQDSQAADVAAHPYATLGGEIIGGGVGGGLKPSLGATKNLGRGLRNLAFTDVRPGALLPAQKTAIANSALGAGIGGGIDIGSQLYHKGTVDPIEAAISTVGGGAFIEPNFLGRKAGLPSTLGPEKFTPQERPANETALDLSQNDTRGNVIPSSISDIGLEGEHKAQLEYALELKRKADEAAAQQLAATNEGDKAFRQKLIDEWQQGGKNDEDLVAYSRRKKQEREQALVVKEAEKNPANLSDDSLIQRWNEVADKYGDKNTTINKREVLELTQELKNRGLFQKASTEEPTQAEIPATMQSASELAHIRTWNDDALYSVWKNIAEDTLAKGGTDTQQADLFSQLSQEMKDRGLYQGATDKGSRLTPAQLSLTEQEANRRGITLGTATEPIPHPAGGQAAGVNFPAKRTIAIRPEVATGDTGPHEILHQFIADLKQSKSPRDQKIVADLLKIVGGNEETLTQAGGLDYIRRLEADVNKPGVGTRIKEWFRDVDAAFSRRFGNMTEEQAARFLATQAKERAGFENDPLLRQGVEEHANGNGKANYQEESGTKVPADMMQFGRLPSSLADYRAWLTKVKGLTPDEAAQVVHKIYTARGDFDTGYSSDRTAVIDRRAGNSSNERFQQAQIPARPYGTLPNETDKPAQLVNSERPTIKTDVYSTVNPNPVAKATASGWDKVRYLGNTPEARKISNYAADAGIEAVRLEDRYNGKYYEQLAQEFNRAKLSSEERTKLQQYRYEMSEYGKSGLQSWYQSNPKVQQVNDAIQANINERAVEAKAVGLIEKLPTNPYQTSVSPAYEVIRQVTGENVTTPQAKLLRDDLTRFWSNKGVKDASSEVKNYVKALGSGYLAGPLKRLEKYGLPFSWVDKDVVSNELRGTSRFAKDISYHRAIETDPVARGIYDISDLNGDKSKNATKLPDGTAIKLDNNPVASSEVAKRVIEGLTTKLSATEQFLTAVSRGVTSGWIGPWSGIKDLAGSVSQNLHHLELGDVGNYVKGISQVRKFWDDSFRLGVNRARINNLEFANESVNRSTSVMNKLSDLLSRGQGRNLLEKVTRALNFAAGRQVAEGVLVRNDPKQIAAWQRKFGQGIDLAKYAGKPNIPDEILNELAAQFTERNQGTYDTRGLPVGAVKGPIAPLLTLSRWGIEKANVMYKDAWLPLVLEKDAKPLLKATLGAILSGEVIRHLGEVINNRLDQVASRKELMEADSPPVKEILYTLMADANVAGYFGILSQIGQDTIRIATGKGTQQGTTTVPVVEFLNQALINNTQDYTQALKTGEPPETATLQFINQILKSTVQAHKIFAAQTFEAPLQERKKENRNLRVFRTLEGNEPVGDIGTTSKAPVITGYSGRMFDRASSPQEAAEYLPGAIQSAATRANGNPYQLMQNIRAVAQQKESRIPSLSNPATAQEFQKYKEFVIKTQGEDAWNSLIAAVKQQAAVNQQKKGLVGKYLQQNQQQLLRR